MAGNSLQQANHFPGDAIPPIPLEPHNYAPQNARVSHEYRDILLLKFLVGLCVSLFQVLPAPQNGHSVGHWEDIHQPGGVADPGRPQDPHHNFDHYVIADYHRRMLHVSNLSPSGAGIP
jgi:hypothetical protein